MHKRVAGSTQFLFAGPSLAQQHGALRVDLRQHDVREFARCDAQPLEPGELPAGLRDDDEEHESTLLCLRRGLAIRDEALPDRER